MAATPTTPKEPDYGGEIDEPHASPPRVATDLLRNVENTSWHWWAVLLSFGAVAGLGVFCFAYQIVDGIGVYGINRPVYWGLAIINFVFWAGVALSGTMISAVLRLLHAGWRRSLSRMTETLTICALAVAGLFPIIHLGRNWVFFWLVPYPNERGLWPNFRSPLLWDFTAISVYLITSLLFWYAGLIPDFAVLRERSTGWRHTLYETLAMGWRGTDLDWSRLKVLSTIMTVLIIPVFVSLHTIVGWDFGMSIVPGWHETIFAPYFVCGALYSGTGAILIIMCIVRAAFRLEKYIQPTHFDNIAKVLFAISLLWFYFFGGDAWTDWFTRDPNHVAWLHYMFSGYKWVLTSLIVFGIVIPFAILPFGRNRRNPWIMLFVGLSVNIGMFTERVTVVVPPPSRNWLVWGNYTPRWPELCIAVGAVAVFGFLYTLLSKFIPLVSLWEYGEGELMSGAGVVGDAEVPLTVREESIG